MARLPPPSARLPTARASSPSDREANSHPVRDEQQKDRGAFSLAAPTCQGERGEQGGLEGGGRRGGLPVGGAGRAGPSHGPGAARSLVRVGGGHAAAAAAGHVLVDHTHLVLVLPLAEFLDLKNKTRLSNAAAPSRRRARPARSQFTMGLPDPGSPELPLAWARGQWWGWGMAVTSPQRPGWGVAWAGARGQSWANS